MMTDLALRTGEHPPSKDDPAEDHREEAEQDHAQCGGGGSIPALDPLGVDQRGRISVACDGAPTAGAVKGKITGKATIPVMNITAASTAQIRRNCGVVMLTKIR